MQGKTLKKKHVAMKVFKTTDLFRSGDFGFTEFRIPALGLATDGTVYAAIAGRMRSGDDWGESAIFVKRSQDGGTTWENPILFTFS